MVPGTVLFDPKFRFHDGKVGQKLFVVLNDGRDGSYICIKTTSQDGRYGVLYGCQITARFPYFYLPQGCCFLTEHTWLCLDEFYEFDAAELFTRLSEARINRIGLLEPALTREIQGCAISSFDISQQHADSIRTVWVASKPKT